MSTLPQLLQAAREYQKQFNKPLKIGVKKPVAIITCMDSRIIPERIFGLDLGDSEIIRNGGGRVNGDVFRSLLICTEILHCKEIIVMHHNDCGAQHAHEQKDSLLRCMRHRLGFFMGAWIPVARLLGLEKYVLLDFPPGDENVEKSVVEDIKKLRRNPLVPRDVPIYGLFYDVFTGAVREVSRDVGTAAPPLIAPPVKTGPAGGEGPAASLAGTSAEGKKME